MQIAAHSAELISGFAANAPAAFAWLSAHWQGFATGAGSMLVAAIWQGAVIVSVLEIATRLMRRISAAHRFALWSAGFGLALALPLLRLLNFGGESAPGPLSGNFSASLHPLIKIDARWGLLIAALWVSASLIRAVALAAHSIRLRRLWKAAQPALAADRISASCSAAVRQLRSGRIAICTTQLLDRPSVIGFLSPRILIPDWLLARLTPGELDQIVLHEAEHLRRGDDWTNLLQKLCLVLFPLNPALAWIELRLCREREIACDEGVVRITKAPRAYAACLASLAERHLERRAEALSLGAWHRRSELVDRVHRILLCKRMMSRTAAGALLAALGSLLAAGSLEMSRLPQLVAFVPTQDADATATQQMQYKAQLDRVLSEQNAEAKLQFPPNYRAVPAKAILPDRPALSSAHTHRKAAVPVTDSRAASNAPAQTRAEQIAKAEQLGDRTVSSQPLPQQWVVVATWREVTSVSRVPQTISDFEPEAQALNGSETTHAAAAQDSTTSAAGAAAASSAKAPATPNQPGAPAHHFTVTQLILRVVPASPNSTSTQPPTTTVRDGWFVIQL